MQQPRPTPTIRTLAAIIAAFAALVLLPAVASAQDPSVDQYTPTAPSGGGNVPTDTASNPGGLGTSGDDDGSGAAVGTSSGGSTPGAETPTGGDPAVGGSAGGGGPKSADERTLDGLAANAAALRERGPERNESAATELLRGNGGDGAGLGVLLWAVLGVTALWAVAMVIRGRSHGGGTPA